MTTTTTGDDIDPDRDVEGDNPKSATVVVPIMLIAADRGGDI